jgi:multiple antibiotic resistance protein
MMLDLAISTFVTMFVIVDPVGLAPLFVALTRGRSGAERRRIALRAALIAGGLILVFGLAGESLLALIGISMPAFRISGGLLLFIIAAEMLLERRTHRRESALEDKPDPSVFPLATPLIAGPAALTSMILMSGRHGGDVAALAVVHLSALSVIALAFVLFLAGDVIERLLGHTGTMVITRLLGILLAAMAVQFVLNGLGDLGLLPGRV